MAMEALTHDFSSNPWTNPWCTDSPAELQAKLDAQAARTRAAEELAARHLCDLELLEERLVWATQSMLRLAERLYALNDGVCLPPSQSFCTLEEAIRLCEEALPPAVAPCVRRPRDLPDADEVEQDFFDAEGGVEVLLPPEDQQSLWVAFNGEPEAAAIPGRLAARRPSSVGISFNDYAVRHAEDYTALKALEPNEGWCYRCTRGGVDIYTKEVEGMPKACFKGVVKIDTHGHGAKALVEALKAHGNRQKWDEMCVSSRVVEEYPPFYSVGYFRFSSGTPFNSDREMIMASHLFFEAPDVIYATCRSIAHEECPEDKLFVRSTLHIGGYIIRPTEEQGVFSVTFAGCVEFGGWVPSWAQDMVAWRQPLSLGDFRAQFESAAREGGDLFLEARGFGPDGRPLGADA